MQIPKKKKWILIALSAASMLVTSFSYYIYQIVYTHNVLVDAEGPAYLKIPRGATFENVSDSLFRNQWVNDMVSFSFLAKLMNYQENVRPGRYEISPNMTNRELIRSLRSGRQSPMNITFNNIRTKEDLAQKITCGLEIQEEDMFALLTDSA